MTLAPKPEDTSVAKFFEEVKVLVRDVPDGSPSKSTAACVGHEDDDDCAFIQG